ncbi:MULTISPECIES: phosphodiester glycosidase family protein [Glaesserella]|uniref:XcbC n=1 Tax=Glaesserella australis TaxID=2094024 RepID=A0A328BYQ4_9PAST|nr:MULTISPECIES: phosphodiester glycosidase family protein [Glaesserella]AUI66484.1 xcbC [Glaesserella sp. 15-184]RAL19478.1 xcbC [Glaesserella australis]
MGGSIITIIKKGLLSSLLFISTVQADTNSACFHIYTENANTHIAKINLSCPNLKIIGTSFEDKGMTVSEFSQKNQTKIAINANFFRKDMTPIGLTISNRKRWENTRDTRSRTIFACTSENKCMIEAKGQITKINPKWAVAVSGWQSFNPNTAKFECATQDKIGCSQDIFTGKHPRTMIGLDEKQNLLYFVVVEGRLLSFSGMNLDELATLASKLKLTKAINLDGGGSSTFVVDTERQSDLPLFQGSEREVSNHLGIKIIN